MIKYLISLALIILFLLSTVIAGEVHPLEKLDSIVAKHPNLNSFLDNSDDLEAYYLTLEDYYGKSKINRDQFNAILEQLKVINKQVPTLGNRLWDTKNTGTRFSIETAISSYGRDLEARAWQDYLKTHKHKLRNSADEFFAMAENERTKKLGVLLDDISLREKNPPKVVGNLAIQKQNEIQNFKNIRASKEVKQIANYYAHEILQAENTDDLLRSGDADLILDTLKELKLQTRSFLPNTDIPSSVLSEIKALLPDQKSLMQNMEIFPEAVIISSRGKKVPVGGTGLAKYEFIPTPRRLHGIWKGIPLGECVGGNCLSLEHLTPERWATSALKDSHLQFVEKNGRYVGFVEAIPVKVNGEVYSSVGFGAPDLRKTIFQNNPQTGEKIKTTLYDQWLKLAVKNKPAKWKGFVVSRSDDINNANALATVRASNSYIVGQEVRSGSKVSLIDPIAKKIVKFSPTEGYAKIYGGNMIVDATTPNSGKSGSLKLLNPHVDDPEELDKALKEIFQRNNQAEISELLKGIEVKNAKLFDSVVPYLANIAKDPSHPLQSKAISPFLSAITHFKRSNQNHEQWLKSNIGNGLKSILRGNNYENIIKVITTNDSPEVLNHFAPDLNNALKEIFQRNNSYEISELLNYIKNKNEKFFESVAPYLGDISKNPRLQVKLLVSIESKSLSKHMGPNLDKVLKEILLRNNPYEITELLMVVRVDRNFEIIKSMEPYLANIAKDPKHPLWRYAVPLTNSIKCRGLSETLRAL